MILAAGLTLGFSLTLNPWGSLNELMKDAPIWRGFTDDGALLAVRVQKMKLRRASCQNVLLALQSYSFGKKFDSKEWGTWAPWSEKDQSIIQECENLPCEVKLNLDEVSQMKKTPPAKRQEQFLRLVAERVKRYLQSGERKEYEFAGQLIGNNLDPWSFFEKRGLASSMKRPLQAELWIRRLDFEMGRLKPLRQILDRRWVSQGTTAMLWIRDIYTSHYFDSWGEWMQMQCDPDTKSVMIVGALMGDLDQLKKHSIFDFLARGQMKKAFEENAQKYLDSIFQALENKLHHEVNH